MKNPSPREVVLLTSGAVSLILFFTLLLLHLIYPALIARPFILLLPLITFLLISVFFMLSIEKFIYRKIKLIYKSIYKLKAAKTGAGSVSSKGLMQRDIIGEVEQKVMEWAETQNQEMETLQKLADYRKEFVSDVSHELKTPIFNIQGYLHTLIDGGIDDPNINVSYLHKASQNLERLSNIVADLEVISHIESNSLILDFTRFEIVKLIKEVIDDLEMKADLKDITLHLKEGADQPRYVRADRERVRQVLVNLVTNSIRYGKENGKTIIGVYDMHENVLVEVTDDGIGIAEDHLPRLFERFYRVDKSRSRELGGTGLGLSIVKHIIEAHGQTIHVRSTPGVGSTFGLTLKKE